LPEFFLKKPTQSKSASEFRGWLGVNHAA